MWFRVVSLRVRLAQRRGGGGGFPFALANMLKVFLGGLGVGNEKAAGHLVECGVARVFHLDNPCFRPADTGHGDGAHLHARGVRDVDFGADEGVVGTIPPPPPLRGEFCLGGRGCPLWPGGGRGRGCPLWPSGAGGGGYLLLGGGWLHPMSHPTQNAIWRFSCHQFG